MDYQITDVPLDLDTATGLTREYLKPKLSTDFEVRYEEPNRGCSVFVLQNWRFGDVGKVELVKHGDRSVTLKFIDPVTTPEEAVRLKFIERDSDPPSDPDPSPWLGALMALGIVDATAKPGSRKGVTTWMITPRAHVKEPPTRLDGYRRLERVGKKLAERWARKLTAERMHIAQSARDLYWSRLQRHLGPKPATVNERSPKKRIPQSRTLEGLDELRKLRSSGMAWTVACHSVPIDPKTAARQDPDLRARWPKR